MCDVLLDEFVVFSDHHAHTFPFGAKEELHESRFFVNSRLRAAFSVIEEITTYVAKHHINKVFFCGDMFHVRESVPTIATNLMYTAIQRLNEVAYVHMLPGNHDYADREGEVHSLHTFRDVAVVHDWHWLGNAVHGRGGLVDHPPCNTKRGDQVRYSFLPYTEDRVKAAKAIADAAELTEPYIPHILLGHLGIQGATVGSDYVLVSDNDIYVADIPWDSFAGCFFGHYHQHQQLFKNGWYVGASHQHNWGDANTKRGFLHVKVYMDHVTFDFIETAAPKFITSKEPIKARPQDFVRIMSKTKSSVQEIEELQRECGSQNCEIIYVPPEVEQSALELSEENLSPSAMVASWVAANSSWLAENLPDLDHEQLIAYGRTLLVDVT